MLNLVNGLYTYEEPGFNQLENEYYYQHVLSNEGQLIEYQNLAEKIATAKGLTVEAIYDQILEAKNDQAKALDFFGAFFVEVQMLQVKQLADERNRPFVIAEMILRSRLRPDWIKANLQELEVAYGPLFIGDELSSIENLHRAEWLSNETRQKAISRLTSILSKQNIRALVAFAEHELMEGQTPDIKLPAELSEVLGKPQSAPQDFSNKQSSIESNVSERIAELPSSA